MKNYLILMFINLLCDFIRILEKPINNHPGRKIDIQYKKPINNRFIIINIVCKKITLLTFRAMAAFHRNSSSALRFWYNLHDITE
jgi:hypothetical protein